jgi:ATP phosphoribosyltransferase
MFKSEAWLVANKQLSAENRAIFDKLVFRLKSVLASRNNKYLLMNAPNENIERIIEILPGMKSPTVMPLAEKGWSSIHTVITEDRFWEIIDRLRENGAQGILVVPIEKMIV